MILILLEGPGKVSLWYLERNKSSSQQTQDPFLLADVFVQIVSPQLMAASHQRDPHMLM